MSMFFIQKLSICFERHFIEPKMNYFRIQNITDDQFIALKQSGTTARMHKSGYVRLLQVFMLNYTQLYKSEVKAVVSFYTYILAMIA